MCRIAAPAASLQKTGTLDLGVNGVLEAGDRITYTFRVQNTGNVTLNSVSIVDPGATLTGGPISLAPGAVDTTTFTAIHIVTQQDIDSGHYQNSATVSATTSSIPLPPQPPAVSDLPLVGTPGIAMAKTAIPNFGTRPDANDTITYQFVVTNTGTLTLHDVNITDALLTASLPPETKRLVAQLEAIRDGVDPVATATISPVVGRARVNVDYAAADEQPPVPGPRPVVKPQTPAAHPTPDQVFPAPLGIPLQAPASAALTLPAPVSAQRSAATPDIFANLNVGRRLVMLQGNAKAPAAGDKIGIVYDLTNSGDAPLVNIQVNQSTGEAFNNSISYLAPGQRDGASIIETQELTQADITAGAVAPVAAIIANVRSRQIVQVLSTPLNLASISSLEQVATATITPATFNGLAPGASTTFTASYTLTQADLDNLGNLTSGNLDNSATATGTVPDNSTSVSAVGNATVAVPQETAIALVKTQSTDLGSDGMATVNDVITYTFTVTNPGNVSLGSVEVTDPLADLSSITLVSGDANGDTNMNPGETWNYQATYAIKQDDIDLGNVTNNAAVTANPLTSTPPVTDGSDPVDPTTDGPTVASLEPTPALTLLKQGVWNDTNTDSVTGIGETIDYTFTITNAGNVTLNTVTLNDPLPGLPAPTLTGGDTDSDNALDVGEVWTYTATYTIGQADIDAGKVENQATVTATPPVGPPVTDLSDNDVPAQNDKTVVTLTQKRGIAVLKEELAPVDVNSNGLVELGDTVNYQITVKNTGLVTITSATVIDTNAVLSAASITNLAPGTTTTITATHIVTADDVTARQVINQVVVNGNTLTAGPVSDTSHNDPATYEVTGNDAPTVTAVSEIRISLIKTWTGFTDINGNGSTDEGDVIRYAFAVTNQGTVPLTNVVITDPLSSITNPIQGTLPATLNPGETDNTSITFEYVITASDMDAGQVVNQATVSAEYNSTTVTDLSDNNSPDENDATVTLVGVPGVALVKTVGIIEDTNGNGFNDAGDVINYVLTVTNNGGIPLTNVVVTDPKITIPDNTIAKLSVGLSNAQPLEGSYVITQDDMNAGNVTNQATVTANSIRGPVSDLSDDTSLFEDDPTVTTLAQVPKLAIIKTIGSVTDQNGNEINDVGDIINYSFSITNTGNVTLTNIMVTDDNAAVVGGPVASLSPGETDSTTITANHPVTFEDGEAGKVINQAIANGATPTGTIVSDVSDDNALAENDVTVLKVFRTAPTITKAASKSEIRRGESVVYTISASNLLGFKTAIRDLLPPSFIYETGSATLNGKKVTPVIKGRTLQFTGYTPDIQGNVVIKLRMMAGMTLTSGRFINKAEVVDRQTGKVLARAEAAVEVKPEHVFDCGDVLGRVFNDLNSNGYPDDGEPGMPGVNVITVNGLIITSDSEGRFHVTCADLPNVEIGSNFLLKLDPASLPTGYVLTTENPRDVRLTRGKVTKLNFGVTKSCDVQLDIRRDAFEGSGSALKPQWSKGINRLTTVLQQCPGKLSVVYRCGEYAPIVDDRLHAVEEAIQSKWSEQGTPYNLVISSRYECGK